MPASPTSTKSGASPEELHAEAFVKCDRPLICRRGYRFDVLATMPPSELLEAAEKLTREALPTGGPPDSNRMHISNRFGLREKAKQISEDLSPVADDKRRVSKLVNEEWMVQMAGVPRTPEFIQLIENLIVVLVGTQRDFCGTAHRRSAGRWRARRDSNPRPPDSKSGLDVLSRIKRDGLAHRKAPVYKRFASRCIRLRSAALSDFVSPVCPQPGSQTTKLFQRKEQPCARF